ncbi:ectonucleoside triphosphate diphosphohydrolase 2-like [Babylonia areolata]|uniref:ectonucleoside triphosphate diphosphohydrolase 2-like n=1 Tax=Babylonia areolata TaxID=304850 RepID=UPI003FD07CA5
MTMEPSTWMTSLLLSVTSLCVMTCQGSRIPHVVGLRSARGGVVDSQDRGIRHRREAAVGQDTPHHVLPKDGDGNLRFGVLLDAGSSSTKVKVYSYTPALSASHVPRVKLEVSTRVRPGLGSFATRSSGGGLTEYLLEGLGYAQEEVPEDLHAITPIYVMATAGMRVLPAMDARDLLEEVRSVLGNRTLNPFLFHPEHVSILSGEEEAVYAWLAVNYLRGFFSPGPSHPEPVGVLEMGGGSMQVAFLPDTPLYQEEFQVYVGQRRFDLYAQSYLRFGSNYLTDQVRRRLLLHQQQQGEGGPGGARGGGGGGGVMMEEEKRLYSPCMLSDDRSTFPWQGETYQVLGTGNATLCEQVLSAILSPPDPSLCSPGPCAIGDTYQPLVGEQSFYAISAFLYAPKHLDAVEDHDVLNIVRLQENARKYCDLTVSEAVAQTGTRARFASNDCLMGLYIPLLLTKALGFQQHARTITVTNDINDTRIDWALGAIVQHLSMTFLDDLDSRSGNSHCHHVPSAPPSGRSTGSPGSRPVTSTLTLGVSLVVTVWSCMCLLV